MSQLDAPETLLGLVERYSPSGTELEAVEWLTGHMLASGFTQAYRDPVGNAVGVLGSGPRQLVLLGHIDTVPGEIPLRVEEGRLYGRGSVDAKGPLAAFVDAAARLGEIPGWQLVVIGAVDEERDSTGARYLVDQYHPEFAVIGEPSQWDRVTLGYKGAAWAELNFRQPLAHTAGPGLSASDQVFASWQAVLAWCAEFNQGRERVFEQVQPSLRGLSSGEDGFQEWASLRVGTRLPLDLPPENWFNRLAELAAPCSLRPLGYPIPAYQADKNSKLARAFLSGIRACGGRPGYLLKTGTADMNIVAPQWGCPVLAYGPGDSALDHTPAEHIVLEDYARAVDVLAHVLREVMGK